MQFSAAGMIRWLIVVSLLAGKTFVILGLGFFSPSVGISIARVHDGTRPVFVSMTAGIGLTVALFVARAAFTDSELQDAANMGALGSLVVARVVLLGRFRLAPRSRKAAAFNLAPPLHRKLERA